MAHFAEIINDLVNEVIVISNDDCAGGNFPESEPAGQAFIKDVLKKPGTWLQTSYNKNFRGNFAGYGMQYIADKDVFMPKSPYPSWVLKKIDESWYWTAPIPIPDDDHDWNWDEETQSWNLAN